MNVNEHYEDEGTKSVEPEDKEDFKKDKGEEHFDKVEQIKLDEKEKTQKHTKEKVFIFLSVLAIIFIFLYSSLKLISLFKSLDFEIINRN